jgi:catechol 2,3-dioxygenase-like lactoylglutathione lyase family enzyme
MLSAKRLIAFVGTRDAARAKVFYQDTLGLRLVSEDRFALTFDAAGTMLRVSSVPELIPAQFTVLGWQVENIQETIQALVGRGVLFERFGFVSQDELGIWAAPSGDRVAWFKDPDGNLLSLSQHVS